MPGAVGPVVLPLSRRLLSFLGWPEVLLARQIFLRGRYKKSSYPHRSTSYPVPAAKGGRLSCLIAVRQTRCSASVGFRVSRISDARQEGGQGPYFRPVVITG